MENSYILSTEEALKYFGVSEDSGLSDDQAKALREKYGSNGIDSGVFHHTLKADLMIDSFTGRPSDAVMATCPRAVQRSTCHNTTWLSGCIVYSGFI